MTPGSSAIVTVAFGHSTEHLDHTFLSFAEKNPGVPLHAFVLGSKLPERRLPQITYHLVTPQPDFSHPLREVYFRRHELIDQLDVEFALVVDSYDVLCLQPLPAFGKILGGCDVAACVEHMGSRYLMGQGYTASFLNGGVFFWNIPGSRDIRREIVERGKSRFRIVADDQFVINEVVQTKYYDRLRILPYQYNYRAYLKNCLKREQRGWPTVPHLDGVMIYHNGPCIEGARKLPPVRPKAILPELVPDGKPLTEEEQFWRAMLQSQEPHIIRESLRYRFLQWLVSKKFVYGTLRLFRPITLRLRAILKRLPNG